MGLVTAASVPANALTDRHEAVPRPAALLWLRAAAAATLLAAAGLHALAAAEHAEYWPTASRFFIALQLAQTWLGLALLLNLRTVVAARAALVVNAATLAVWVLSRTIGLPIGPDAGTAEPVGRLDLAVAALQVISIAATILLIGRWRAGARLRAPATTAVVLVGVLLLTIWGATAPDTETEPAGHTPSTSHDQPDPVRKEAR